MVQMLVSGLWLLASVQPLFYNRQEFFRTRERLVLSDHHGHRQRLWERFEAQGLRGFYHPHEKLEFLLTFALPRKDTKPVAKALLTRFGTLGAVLSAPPSRLADVAGVGARTAGFLRALGETALAVAEERLVEGELLARPEAVKRYLIRELAGEEAEFFLALYLDSQNRLVGKQRLFRGTNDRVAVFPREVVKEGLACNAAGALVAHNHPSGELTPSKEDVALTKRLARALAAVEIALHDHLVVGRGEAVSLRELGLFPPRR